MASLVTFAHSLGAAETRPQHFLNFQDIATPTLHALLADAKALKAARGSHTQPLAGRKLGMIFEKNSTRTRVSFEVAMLELGGHAIYLNSNDLQLGRGETIADTARVLSRYVDAIMLRALKHETLTELAAHATVPVINGLTDCSHPCQLLADLLTVEERLGALSGKTVAWLGDGNNVCASWIEAAAHFGFTLRIATPKELKACPQTLSWAIARGAKIEIFEGASTAAEAAVEGAHVVTTDVWVSMGANNAEDRKRWCAPFRVTEALMNRADRNAVFLHCLPAVRGEEVDAAVIDGPHSAVWDEAENRLHVQKAVLRWSMAS